MDEINHLSRFGQAETGSIGSSEDGRLIPYVFAGSRAGKCVFITAGIHAREHISSYCVMRQIYFTLNRLKKIEPYGGIYFIPMLNPDGNEMIKLGADAVRRKDKNLLRRVLCGADQRLYKANANAVDLNVNFAAGWGTGKQNVFLPAMENYVGPRPFSEAETRALRDFTVLKNPAATVSYHCLGRELYWEYGQTGARRDRDRQLAGYLNERLDYAIVDDDKTSAGGYKDWCVEKLGIPAFTIELAEDCHCHPFTNYALAEEDIERNLDLPQRLLEAVNHF